MDDFLLVTPEGWTEITNANDIIRSHGMEETAMADLIKTRDWAQIMTWAEEAGIITPPQQITDGRLYDIGSETAGDFNIRLWFVIS